MKILVLMGVYDAEAGIAPKTLAQLIKILQHHEMHLLISDDASKVGLGEQLAHRFRPEISGTIEVLRIEQSAGYLGTIDRTLNALRLIAESGQQYDYVLRIDTDIHFCRAEIAQLFDSTKLPHRGIIGPIIKMRKRDFLLYLLDLFPVGFRRRKVNDRLERQWEFGRLTPVWWAGAGLSAVWNGFWREMVSGPFQLIAWDSLMEIHRRNLLSRNRNRWGLTFGDDVLTNTLVKTIGHPIVNIQSILPDFSCALFLAKSASEETVIARGLYLIHPMKDNDWANALRDRIVI